MKEPVQAFEALHVPPTAMDVGLTLTATDGTALLTLTLVVPLDVPYVPLPL